MDEDEELLDEILKGHDAAAKVFIDRYKFVAWGVFRRFRQFTKEDCEDLFSDLCRKFWEDDCRRLRELRAEWQGGSLEGYVRKAARNLAIDRFRQLEAMPEVEPDDPKTDVIEESVEPDADPVFLNQLRRMIELAFQKLKERCRKALRLVHFEDLSYAEAARELGMNANAFAQQLKRCRAELAKVFDCDFPALRTYFSEAL